MLSFAPIIVGSFFTPIIMAKCQTKCNDLGNAIVVLGTVILALFPENYDLIKVGLIVRGLGIAPTAVASYAMLGDVADYGEWKTGTVQMV